LVIDSWRKLVPDPANSVQTLASGRPAIVGVNGRLGNVGDGNIIQEVLDIRVYKEWPTPNERVRLGDLVTAAKAVARATVRLCG
jgi:acetylornithine deacetylase/succinyl-diaminopimelate desuccinylase-like protein